MRTIKKISISETLLLQLLGNLFDLPEDTQIVQASHTSITGSLEIIIHSEGFPKLIEGCEPPNHAYRLNQLDYNI